ncbi:uncharacterized protein OCT59_021664 [Rhizophagus irregularis]|uniref:Ubiquitin-like domain-containing protein n=5 Tax=Rhizophagus irregularis TaxID=588596 RepID=A0A015IP96_RHIIW|nr:hypothetical protein RirG_219560 [Rhizophagus irregularis DAOM 197198w]UZO28121.1 hypothetical protein OCT59_021664 [Rhizophagus irregularis]GBC16194.2 ubiquitin domain-containing protein [Rhizophagus irregularis DAOM 181602=DAOM 197198]
MNESRILLLLCMSICSSFLGLYIFIEVKTWTQYKEYEETPFPSTPSPFNSADMVASALTSVTNSHIITYNEYLSRKEEEKNDNNRIYEELNFQTFYKAYLSGGIISSSSHHKEHDDKKYYNSTFNVYIESLTGIKLLIQNLNYKTKVQELKERILDIGIVNDTTSQRLVFNGQRLINTNELRNYHIGNNNIIYLDIRSYYEGGSNNNNNIIIIKYLNSDFLNSELILQSLKMKNINKSNKCEWMRIFLTTTKERNFIKYWPYSYHGTSTRNAKRIADDGFIHSKGYKFNFNHGIFTTPDINLAASYANTFIYDGSKYLVLFQNRVNPKSLIKIPFKRGKGSKYWVSPSVDDVKPYALLIKKIGYCK